MSRRKKQHWFQFQISLRTLLVVTTLAGILAGFYGPSVYRALRTSLGLHRPNRASTRWVTVSGTVTIDGKPLAGADVGFHAQNWGSVGSTDENGAYALSVTPGSYVVTISKVTGPYTLLGGGTETGDHPTEMGIETIPKRYSGSTSVLKYSVGANEVRRASFSLTTQDGDAPFSVPVQ